MSSRWLLYPLAGVLTLVLAGVVVLVLAAVVTYPKLPSLDSLKDYHPKMPLRVFTSDGALIGEFGEERRALVKITEVPKVLKDAILSAEDERFYQHGGVDYVGVARAALNNLVSGGAREGASTITMQVARNFFLTPEKTLSRKFSEALLAFKIEHTLSKDQILELYLNQIYLGQRAYGFAAASQIYFGKPVDQLTAAEAAMLAGLPKAPSRYNPVVNPQRAKARQQYVLGRMRALGYLDQKQYEAALNEPLKVRHDLQFSEVAGDYVAEMVRQVMYERYQDAIYSQGFSVYTTIRKADQEAANQALWRGVADYDRRHGYRGPEGFVELPSDPGEAEEAMDDALQGAGDAGDLVPAVVLEAHPNQLRAYTLDGERVQLGGEGLRFAQRFLTASGETNRIRRGSLIRLQRDDKLGWRIAQLPQIESALVSMDPNDGAVRALVGGFDFERNKFNHVTQAWRQPGSSFKPFIYSAALEKGFTAASVINDAPLVIDAAEAGGKAWEPKNFEGTYSGPVRLRVALTKSLNLVSVRLIQSITPQYAQEYIQRFGFSPEQHPPYLTMALGAGSVTPLQMVTAYSVFANGGYRVKPYFIDRILDARGKVLARAQPTRVGTPAVEQAIDPRNAFIMTSMMQDVVRQGTGARAMQLGRHDLAGKTGTTSESVDAWFCGFNPDLVAVAWIGYDHPRSMGGAETGAQAALPIWMGYMAKALQGVPERQRPMPDRIVVVNINPATGTRAAQGGIPEYFYEENPPGDTPTVLGGGEAPGKASEEVKDQLF